MNRTLGPSKDYSAQPQNAAEGAATVQEDANPVGVENMAASTVAANGLLEDILIVKSKKLSGAKRLMNQDRRHVQTALAPTAFHDPQRGKRKNINICMLCRPSEYLYILICYQHGTAFNGRLLNHVSRE